MMDMIEVTSLNRPDENWKHVDAAGHVHQWEWPDGRRVYQPTQRATIPTCDYVHDRFDYYDGDEIERFKFVCKDCGEDVKPGTCADQNRVFVPGFGRGR